MEMKQNQTFFQGTYSHLINKIFRLSQKSTDRLIIKTFEKHLVCFKHQNHVMYLENRVSF